VIDYDYEMVVLDPERFTSMAQVLVCCWDVGLQSMASTQSQRCSRKNGGLTQLLALEQPVRGRTRALFSKNTDRTAKKLYALAMPLFSVYIPHYRSLERHMFSGF
jgi:hypothetical protein